MNKSKSERLAKLTKRRGIKRREGFGMSKRNVAEAKIKCPHCESSMGVRVLMGRKATREEGGPRARRLYIRCDLCYRDSYVTVEEVRK